MRFARLRDAPVKGEHAVRPDIRITQGEHEVRPYGDNTRA